MIFYERLGLFQFLGLVVTGERAFYGTKSIAVRLLEKFKLKNKARKLDFGDVCATTDIRRNAYEKAKFCSERAKGRLWAEDLSGILRIDFWLVVRSYLVDELYFKFEFFELAIRYASENLGESHVIHVNEEFLGEYKEKLAPAFRIHPHGKFRALGFFSVFLVPLGLKYYVRRHGLVDGLNFSDEIVCEVDGEIVYEMFDSLFKDFPSKRFVIEKRNLKEFTAQRLSELQIRSLGLTKGDYAFLRNAAIRYISRCLRHWREIVGHGSRLFMIFTVLVRGRADTIEGTGNLYLTFEHLVTYKNVRNEFLRAGKSKSIFVPYNSDITYQHYHSELRINYDVKCLAGRVITDFYKNNDPETKIFPKTGSYDCHRGGVRLRDREKRVSSLKSFVGDCVAITILTPGICDPTYRQEIGLMKLARELSACQGVKVLIRLKPVAPIAKYADFYRMQTAGCESILVTFSEYELMDFLEVTDLFVTSLSSSAFDVAKRGGQVVFVDYMKEPDFYNVWTAIKGVVLSEEESLSSIIDWIENDKDRKPRERHNETMRHLVEYIGYRFGDFESYRENLLTQLRVACGDPVQLRRTGGEGQAHRAH